MKSITTLLKQLNKTNVQKAIKINKAYSARPFAPAFTSHTRFVEYKPISAFSFVRSFANEHELSQASFTEKAEKIALLLKDEHQEFSEYLEQQKKARNLVDVQLSKNIYDVVKRLLTKKDDEDTALLPSNAKLIALSLALQFNDYLTAIKFIKACELNSKLDFNREEDRKKFSDQLLSKLVRSYELPKNLKFWQAYAVKHWQRKGLNVLLAQADKIEKYVHDNRPSLEVAIQLKIKSQHENALIKTFHEIKNSIEGLDQVAYLEREMAKAKANIKRDAHQQLMNIFYQETGSTPKDKDIKEKIIQYKSSEQGQEKLLALEKELAERTQTRKIEEYQHAVRVVADGLTSYLQTQMPLQVDSIKSNCSNAYRHIFSPHTDWQTMEKYAAKTYYKNADANPEAAELFYKHGVLPNYFDRYLTLVPNDSDTRVPEVFIKGDEIGHPEYHLTKLNSSDPIAAVLGKVTGCCQSIDGAASTSVEYGITRPQSGFYVLRENKTNQIVAQAWVYRIGSVMVFDSVEPQIVYRERKLDVTLDFFRELAKTLALEHDLKVYVGRSENTPKALIGRIVAEPPHLIDFEFGYTDARAMYLLSGDGSLEKIYAQKEAEKHAIEESNRPRLR